MSKVSRFEVTLDENEHMVEQVIIQRQEPDENPSELVSLPYRQRGDGHRRIKKVYIVYTNTK